MEMKLKSCFLKLLPYAAMVMTECLDNGLTTVSKAAMSKGMSHFVFVFYSTSLSALIMFPVCLFFNRAERPAISFPLLCKFFILSTIGTTLMQNCVFTGVSYSSPTLSAALGQLIPAYTFVLAVIFRMEKLDLKSSKSQIKIMGTLVSISGALTIIFYRGAAVGAKNLQNPSNFLTATNNWIIGGLFISTAGLSVGICNTFQAAILKDFSSKTCIVFFYCLFGAIQCGIVAFIAEKNPNAWQLGSYIELISVIYAAIFGSIVFGIVTWCIEKKGPVFVALFKPLGIAIAALLGVIFLGDTVHVGSILGAAIIVVGLYTVIWAQSKEEEQHRHQVTEHRSPLLESHANV